MASVSRAVISNTGHTRNGCVSYRGHGISNLKTKGIIMAKKTMVQMPEWGESVFSITEGEWIKRLERERFGYDSFHDWMDEAEMMVVGTECRKILKVTAEWCRNLRISNYFGDTSGILDVWITAISWNGCDTFQICNACLSDVWSICGEEDRKRVVRVRTFKQQLTQ